VRKLIVLLLASLAALPSFADEKQKQTFFSETIEVRVVNVDVVVTDKNGKPVTGLSKDDFQLFENGKPQPITNFLEMRGNDTMPTASTTAAAQQPQPAAERPADTRSRNIVVFVDTSTIHPFIRDRVFKPMDTFLRRSVRAGDHVMIVTWAPGLRVEQPFTNNLNDVAATLARLTATSTNALSAARDKAMSERLISNLPADYSLHKDPKTGMPEKPPITDAILVAVSYAEKVTFEQSQRVEALKSVIASMRGLGGRNALVVLTNEISSNPTEGMFQFIDGLKDKFLDGETYNWMNEAKRYDDPELPRKLGDLANSCGVTLYPISAAGLGIDMDSLSAENLGAESMAVTRPMMHADQGLLTLQQIAAATGGAALTGSNNFDLAFNTLTSDMTTYYSLGYHPEGERKDVVRDIAVKLNKKGYTVRARKSFVEKSLQSEMNDAVAANLMYPIARNDLSITVKPAGAAAPTPDQHTVVPVMITVPMSALTLIPDGTDLVGQFSSYTAFMRADGKISEVKTQQHQFRFPADSLKRRKELTMKMELTIDPKTESVSMGIMDDTSHATGFATMKLNQGA
jgi:VWFA-related protein